MSVSPTVQLGGPRAQPTTPTPVVKPADSSPALARRQTARFRPSLNVDSWGGPTEPEVPKPSGGPLSDLDGTLADVDDRFDDLLAGGPTQIATETPYDLSEMREIFAQIAAGHMRPLRDFMIELQWGDPPIDWIGICRPSIAMLRKASEQVKIVGLCAALDELAEQLSLIQGSGARVVAGDDKLRIQSSYATLMEILPQTFALSETRNQREAIIVNALLQQVPDVGKVTIDKLYAAGIGTLEVLFVAKAEEVAAAAGIERRLAERIVQRFRWYRSELDAITPDEKRSPERTRLAKLLGDLTELQLEFQEVSTALPDDATTRRKRELRNGRGALMSEIQVVLARMGAVALVRELERLPFEKKIEAIDRHLSETE